MRLRALLASLAAIGAVALAAAPAQAAPLTCPGTFSVLHDDTIGFVAVPKGSYQLTTLDPAALSCASATAAFARFLQDFDGRLPSPWQLNALTGTFVRGNGPAAFEVAPAARPVGPPAGGSTTHPTGDRCPGTFRVLHNDRIGRLRLPAGRYRITLGPSEPIGCAASSRALTRFLARPAGRLPQGWRLAPATATFSRNGVVAFRMKPAGRAGR
jgi:hypothetical protein